MSLSSQIDYAVPDIRPATNAKVFSKATAEAGVNLRTVSGCPPAPTCAIEAACDGATPGLLTVVLAGGGTAQIYLPANGIPQFRRIAAISITANPGTALGTAGFVTAYWGSEFGNNA